MDHQDQTGVVEQWLVAVGRRDIEAEQRLWTPDGVLELPFAADPARRSVSVGDPLAGFRRTVASLVPALVWRDVAFLPVNDDVMVVEAAADGVAVNGRQFAGRYCMVFRFRSGRIGRIVEYADPGAVARAFTTDELAAALGG